MTRVLQFRCLPDPPSSQLRALTTEMVNTWSRLQRLAGDPEYQTAPFDVSIWRAHTSIPGLWWMNYSAIYSQIGDDGRKIADQMLGTGPLQGILRMAPLVQAIPGSNLELVDVDDLVGAGYIRADGDTGGTSTEPEPMPDDDPPPFVPDPDDDPDLSLRDTTPPEIEIPSVGWVFIVATTAQVSAMAQAATDAGLDDDQDQIHRAGSSSNGTPRWALKKHKLGPALLEIYGHPYWQEAAPAIWGANAQWPAEVPYA